MMKKNRAFLKWAGGKFGLIEDIKRHLPQEERLIEPFVGAGSVFLNTDYKQYLLNDINPDLIHLYQILQQQPDDYIKESEKFFAADFNDSDRYYDLRNQFNLCSDKFERALMFLYFNRHGYNGLCRYNKKGGFNVPFGRYKKPYFPAAELWFFAEKAQQAEFVCESYSDTFARASSGDVIYCDPPYAPLSTSASFTSYAANGFTLDDQAVLGRLSRETAARKIPVLVSNHDIELTRELYHGAQLNVVHVKRTISSKGSQRNKVAELLALF
ncbi:Dam family site-specific DNA-(adenine-N6)-methyltransferase [Motilimonas cestriensis]|uniref:Site-specific DNA-methyltransferase (adenine-specific) n=1 Tax=Motilimonas cestriensis TaxID=2742685 RepID=A0ABS8WA69_9GAMM|nr:Dam family site-specific DNA-(adenine-N6)-methyltransferase [Motilimonas cestriensis]